MDKNYFINDYLQGKHPIEENSWELPTEDELDRDEALYDTLLAERNHSPLLWRGWGRLCFYAAAVLVAVFALFTWKSHTPQPPKPSAVQTAKLDLPEDTPSDTSKHIVLREATHSASMTNAARCDGQHIVLRSEAPRQAVVEAPQSASDSVVLSNAADSLYYYLTKLEEEMGDCRDSTCLAELTGLMRADERIKDLVNKIIHKQVETAYQEEYLVDTTTRYIPL